jgi:hypothetical protein
VELILARRWALSPIGMESKATPAEAGRREQATEV